MAKFERFNFKTLEDLQNKIEELGVDIHLQEDLEPLQQPVSIGKKTAPNAMAVLPMEGCDARPDGGPSELLRRRYHRFASGGSGLLWWEACAVVNEGRANPLQMMITRDNVAEYADLLKECNALAEKENGQGHVPVNIVQLTHSGRYSRPVDKAAPIIAQHDPILDPRVGIDESQPVVTDDYLDELQQRYVDSALLCQEAGFDGVDIKACHRYLVSELLASHTREGKYGGSFENRSRFLLETVRKVKEATGDNFIVACRFNVFDAHPYPYGFGEDEDDFMVWDSTEPLRLVELLVEAGVELLSNSGGNPYYIYPQVTRPFDQPTVGGNTPDEHPLVSIERLFDFTRKIQQTAGDVPVVGNGYSWLRQFLPHVGAANVADGSVAMVGLGRQSFAYPDSAKDIFTKGELDPRKCCTACSRCTQIMRDYGTTGCVIRDTEIYVPLYQKFRAAAQEAQQAK